MHSQPPKGKHDAQSKDISSVFYALNLDKNRLNATQLLHESGYGMLQTAILHYVNGGLPALAAQSVIRNRWGSRLSPDVLEALLGKLASSSQHDAAGDLLEHLQRYDEALNSFRSCAILWSNFLSEHVHILSVVFIQYRACSYH